MCINFIFTIFLRYIRNFIIIHGSLLFIFFLQRGSDELLSQSNVSVMAPSAPHADNNNQENAKKVRIKRNFVTIQLVIETC